MVNTIGIRFVLANVCMALWTLFFSLHYFLVSEIFLLLAAVCMLSIYILLLFHPPSNKRPFDTLFIHAPMRMFLLVLINIDIWQVGLLSFRWYKYVGDEPYSPERPGKWYAAFYLEPAYPGLLKI